MTIETFANILPNQTQPTLGADVLTTPAAGSSESWTVIVPSGLTLPTLGGGTQMRCQIGNEIIIVQSGLTTAGTRTWTVTRGAESSTIEVHANGSSVNIDLTAGAMASLPQTAQAETWTGQQTFTGPGGSTPSSILQPAAAQTARSQDVRDTGGTSQGGWNADGTLSAPNLAANPMTATGQILAGGSVVGGVATPTTISPVAAGDVLTDNGTGALPTFQLLGKIANANGSIGLDATSAVPNFAAAGTATLGTAVTGITHQYINGNNARGYIHLSVNAGAITSGGIICTVNLSVALPANTFIMVVGMTSTAYQYGDSAGTNGVPANNAGGYYAHLTQATNTGFSSFSIKTSAGLSNVSEYGLFYFIFT